MSDRGAPASTRAALAAILEDVLVLALVSSASGCAQTPCEATGVGRVPTKFIREVTLPPPAVINAARVGPDGLLDEATCAAACDRPEKCRFATSRLTWEPAPAFIRCEWPSPSGSVDKRIKDVPRPANLDTTGLADNGNGYILGDHAFCTRVCKDDAVEYCSAIEAIDPPPPPTTKFVVCESVHMAFCPSTTGPWFRMPAGRVSPDELSPAVHTTGDLFAAAASLEAASVAAFHRCARALASFGAPAALVRRARAAANDERRHTRAMHRLAARFGRTSPLLRTSRDWSEASRAPTRRRPTRPRHTLFSFALENAIEGCAGETIGALFAMHQARFAADADVCQTMRAIARDEIEHAALAWSIHAWCSDRLSAVEIAGVRHALDAALRRFITHPPRFSDAIAQNSGVPSPAVARALAETLVAQIF